MWRWTVFRVTHAITQAGRPIPAPSPHPLYPHPRGDPALFAALEKAPAVAFPRAGPSPDPLRGGSFGLSPNSAGPALSLFSLSLEDPGPPPPAQPSARGPRCGGNSATATPISSPGSSGSRPEEPPAAMSAQSPRPPEPSAPPRSAAGS